MKWSFRNHQQVAGENSNLRRSWFGALALIAATSTLPLSAQANQEASIADTWYTLSVDDESTVCGAYADFTNGMRIAFAKIGQDWMFSLTNSAWNLTQGAEYKMSVAVDGRPFRAANVAALHPTAVVITIIQSFLRAFTAGQGLVVYGPFGNIIGRFSLKGTSKAVSAVGACNEYLAQRSTTQNPLGDPVRPAPAKIRRFNGPEKDA